MIQIINGDASAIPLDDESIQCVITSPPYFGLRDYGTGTWVGGNLECDHLDIDATKNLSSGLRNDGRVHKGLYSGEKAIRKAMKQYGKICKKCGAVRIDDQIGIESDPKDYIANMVEVFSEVKRVLRDDGVLWLNIGDAYNSSPSNSQGGSVHRPYHENSVNIIGRQKRKIEGLKEKDLIGIPWQLAFALRDDGWYLRSAIPWIKPNSMPEPATDRPNVSHEYWFLLTKKKRYYYDHVSVLVEYQTPYRNKEQTYQNGGRNFRTYDTFFDSIDAQISDTENYLAYLKKIRNNGGALLSSDGDPLAMIFNTASYSGAHYATFPPGMIVPLIKASVSKYGCCDKCKTPYKRVLSRKKHNKRDSDGDRKTSVSHTGRTDGKTDGPSGKMDEIETIGWKQQCSCKDAGVGQSVVLDPFGGSGTVALVAKQLSINAIGIDLNYEYCKQAVARIGGASRSAATPRDTSQISILDMMKER